ncbi:MAG: DegT/DnrJ/EryC1/StrS family aminotransferase [Terriglobia bacterium]
MSVPHMGGTERQYVEDAFDKNWITTKGENLDEFEKEFTRRIGLPAVGLASGTAAIHLGLRLLGVERGDEVFCSDLTFAASANPILYLDAKPVFIDSDRKSWNLDPVLLTTALEERARSGRLPKAIIVVHLYGHCADMDPILNVCQRFHVPVLEDAAEAAGAFYKARPAGSMGAVGVFSFNGNKIITTSSGGMLVSPDKEMVERARFWSTQAKDPGIEYNHSQLGYNYRMSNVLAGIGRGQMEVLDRRVQERRAVAFRYRDAFAKLSGITFMPESTTSLATHWLSCFLIDEAEFGCTRDQLIDRLLERGIESRPVWKPMHLQELYKGCECIGGEVAADLYRRGICLPSSSSLTEAEQSEVIEIVTSAALCSANPGAAAVV